jgi:hypothetical protein
MEKQLGKSGGVGAVLEPQLGGRSAGWLGHRANGFFKITRHCSRRGALDKFENMNKTVSISRTIQ